MVPLLSIVGLLGRIGARFATPYPSRRIYEHSGSSPKEYSSFWINIEDCRDVRFECQCLLAPLSFFKLTPNAKAIILPSYSKNPNLKSSNIDFPHSGFGASSNLFGSVIVTLHLLANDLESI